MPKKRFDDPETYVHVVGTNVHLAVGDAGFDDTQAGKLLEAIARGAKKVQGVRRVNISLVDKTLEIAPRFGNATKDQVRQIMQALVVEITKIFRHHFWRAARSRQGLVINGV